MADNQVNVLAGGERFIEDKYSASLNKHEGGLGTAWHLLELLLLPGII